MDKLPLELHEIIRDYLDRIDIQALAQCSKSLYSIYQPNVWKTMHLVLRDADEIYEQDYDDEEDEDFISNDYYKNKNMKPIQMKKKLKFAIGRVDIWIGKFTRFLKALQSEELDKLLKSVKKVYIDDSERGISTDEVNIVNQVLELLEDKLVNIRFLQIVREYCSDKIQPVQTSLDIFVKKIEDKYPKCEINVTIDMRRGCNTIYPKGDKILFKHLKTLTGQCDDPFNVMKHFWNIEQEYLPTLRDLTMITKDDNAKIGHTTVLKRWLTNSNELDMLCISALNAFDGEEEDDKLWWLPKVNQLALCDNIRVQLPKQIITLPDVKCFRVFYDVDTIGNVFRFLRFPSLEILSIDPTEVDEIYDAGKNLQQCLSESNNIHRLIVSMACEDVFKAYIHSSLGQKIDQLWIRYSAITASSSHEIYNLMTKLFSNLKILRVYPSKVEYSGYVGDIWDHPDPSSRLRDKVLKSIEICNSE